MVWIFPCLAGSYSCEVVEEMAELIWTWILLAAHTISQRLRTLRKIPPELLPLGTSHFA